MNILNRLQEDLRQAMKSKDETVLNVVRQLKTAITNKAIAAGKDLEESEALQVIKAEGKKMRDSLESFVAAARNDLVATISKEIKVIDSYLPEQISDDALRAHIQAKLALMPDLDKTKTGQLVGELLKELDGQADGRRIKAILENLVG